MPADVANERLQRYFKHFDPTHQVLEVGDRAVACQNVRRALALLADGPDDAVDPTLFEPNLRETVRAFQISAKHRAADGLVGPGTRKLFVDRLLEKGISIFLRLKRTEVMQQPSAFLSYTGADDAFVNQVEKYLTAHGTKVVRDISYFIPALTLEENIIRAVAHVDRVVAIYSAHSRNRDWPRVEREITENVERRLGTRVLLYIQVDDTALPPHDSNRLSIRAQGKSIDQIGSLLLSGIQGDEYSL